MSTSQYLPFVQCLYWWGVCPMYWRTAEIPVGASPKCVSFICCVHVLFQPLELDAATAQQLHDFGRVSHTWSPPTYITPMYVIKYISSFVWPLQVCSHFGGDAHTIVILKQTEYRTMRKPT